MQMKQMELQIEQAEKMEKMMKKMQTKIDALEDENGTLRDKRENYEDKKYDNIRVKCPKWKKVDSLESFKNMVKVWNTTCKADPGIKLIQILEAIEEDHPEAYRRIKLETIDNEKFDKTNENVVEECLKTLDKYFGKSTW